MEYLKAFLCGGVLCVIGQILIDKTTLTPAKILVTCVTAGVVLSGVGVYQCPSPASDTCWPKGSGRPRSRTA